MFFFYFWNMSNISGNKTSTRIRFDQTFFLGLKKPKLYAIIREDTYIFFSGRTTKVLPFLHPLRSDYKKKPFLCVSSLHNKNICLPLFFPIFVYTTLLEFKQYFTVGLYLHECREILHLPAGKCQKTGHLYNKHSIEIQICREILFYQQQQNDAGASNCIR